MTSILRALGVLDEIALYDGTAVAVAADANGTAVDLAGKFDGDIMFVGNLSHAGSGGGSGILKVQHSDDGSTGWADVTGVTCSCTATAPGRFRIVKDLAEIKRFIRSVLDITGSVSVVADCAGLAMPVKKATG